MITIFATPKAFTDPHINTIQRNAFESWRKLNPTFQIILFGDESGTAKTASKYGFEHVRDIKSDEFKTPLLDSVFEKIESIARHDILMYINCDIVLMNDFINAVEKILASVKNGKFLIGGERWDTDIKEQINFENPNWQNKLREFVIKNSKLHGPTGIDYFIFNKGLFGEIPPFAIGRFAWDSWLIWKARREKAYVINATPSIMAVHENHPQPRNLGGEEAFKEERRRNTKLAGPNKLHLDDANFIFENGQLRKPSANLRFLKRRILYTFPALHPTFRPLSSLVRFFYSLFGSNGNKKNFG